MKKYLYGQPFTLPQYLLFHHFMLSVGYIELTEQHSLVKFLVAIKTLLEIDCIYCISYYFWVWRKLIVFIVFPIIFEQTRRLFGTLDFLEFLFLILRKFERTNQLLFPLKWKEKRKFSDDFRGLKFTVCSCHVTHAFQSESTLYSCLNVKELLSRNKCDIWSLSDCNGTGTHNHLVRKRTLNYLAELAKLVKWLNGLMWSPVAIT